MSTGRVNNVIRIPTSLKGTFFRIWMEYLTPLHNLANREKDVVAAIIKKRFELSKSITDPDLLDKVVMSKDMKNKIKEECNLSDTSFHVILSKLRRTGVIVDGRINHKFIPKNLNHGDQAFQFLLYFDLDAGDH